MPGATGIATGTFNPSENVNVCDALARDMPSENPNRFDELIEKARAANVAISPVNPVGLTANATVSWETPDRHLALELSAYNIFDTEFDIAVDTPGWGRTVVGSVSVRF